MKAFLRCIYSSTSLNLSVLLFRQYDRVGPFPKRLSVNHGPIIPERTAIYFPHIEANLTGLLVMNKM